MSSESRSRPPVPDLLRVFDWAERFELLDCIGSGAMGQVWRARERETEKIVALKMLDPARVGDEQTLARLDIEAATLMKLREAGAHANVVPILDFKLTESHACLVMEFIPGLNLKKWCEAHRLGLRERVHLIAQVARASGWFHAQGIVHRDLKPANILVNAATHQPVIVDFSIAKLDDSLPITLTNEALGTAPYMAPEQIDRRRGGITPATDVYALGATLYELLTQVHPHPGDLTQVVRRHAEEVRPAPPSALNPEVPRDLECIILKALSHRPGDRYADGTAMAEDLERFLAGEPVKARRLSLVTRIFRRARQKPALTAALAACLALGAFALWNVKHEAAQRQVFALESRLTAAMHDSAWTAADLETGEITLTALNEYDPALAAAMRLRQHDDIIRDMEARLSQNHLRDEDFAWLHATADWLKPHLPTQARRLQKLIVERLGRWETQAELHVPFADMQGLFPVSKVQPKDNLLYPIYNDDRGPDAAITVTKSVTVPMEVSCLFVAPAASFHSITLVFFRESSRVSAGLQKVQDLPTSLRRSLGIAEPDPQSYVLVLSHNSNFKRAIHIPDTHLLDQPFRLTLRVEREWAEADINGLPRLRVVSPFAMGSRQAGNYWRIQWPKDIGLKELALRTRRSDTVSPLEQADLLAMQGSWAEARRLYEDLRGDPLFGDEASYKTGQCFLLEGDLAAAFDLWDRLAQGPSSRWRDRSLLQLWVESVLRHDHEASARYLDMLPESNLPSLFQQFDPWRLDSVVDAYAAVGMGIALPRVNIAAVAEATKAYRLLQVPKVQTANRFAMAHHFAGLDQEARRLYELGLADPAACATLALNLLAGTNCLDQWCRIVPTERDAELMKSLSLWQKTLKENPTVQAIAHMEKARRAARAGDMAHALVDAKAAHGDDKTDDRVLTSALLLKGALHRMEDDEARAQLTWHEALDVARTVTMQSPLYLCDCILLHSLTQSWNLKTATEVLTALASRHLQADARSAAQAAFNQTFLTDPAWLTTFNAVLQDERGRKFAEDYALCREPPRELVRRFYFLLFEHYFLITSFPLATAEQSTRVRQIVDQLVTEMAMNPRGEIADLYAYLRAWNDPAAALTLFHKAYPYSPELIENMKWLLSMRQRQRIVRAGE